MESSYSVIWASPSSPVPVTSDQKLSHLFRHNEAGLLFSWKGTITSPFLKGLNSNLHSRTQICHILCVPRSCNLIKFLPNVQIALSQYHQKIITSYLTFKILAQFASLPCSKYYFLQQLLPTSLSWSCTFLILRISGVSIVEAYGFPFSFLYFSLYLF